VGIINILDAQTANMIAAGEVVDRPASALKELIENAIDAGATSVNVEIKGGGSAYMRVTDNGSGFARDDMPKALLRHATSKIKTGADLDGIMTLGFRGEALAAISSVSRIEIISRRKEDKLGTRLTGDENGIVMADTGCPAGTTVIVKDLFYNVPARQKFLKRDATEAAAAAAAAERIAVSHPEVSISFISEGEKKFQTPGDGKLLAAIYAVFGRDLANGLKEIDYELDGIRISGYVTSPDNARGSRNLQIFFVNGRFIRSKTIMAALEEAFRSYLPHGKYPAGIINLTLNARSTDVNVHPAKLEIKFADERKIFEVVYYAVKNMLVKPEKIIESRSPVKEEKQSPVIISEEAKPKQAPVIQPQVTFTQSAPPKNKEGAVIGYEVFKPTIGEEDLPLIDLSTDSTMVLKSPLVPVTEEERKEIAKKAAEPITFTEKNVLPEEKAYRIIGEAYNAYIFVELADKVLIIDKHAAHERVLYESLKDKKESVSQQLLEGITVTLPTEQIDILTQNLEYLTQYGFAAEPFGYDTLIIRAVPAVLSDIKDIKNIIEDFAAKLAEGNALSFEERCDRALFTVACKAAMKAGQKNDPIHNEWLVERLLTGGDIHYCPHGRPVLKTFYKREIEKFFDR
jgi:DNA mismatch repair protein MutL